MITATVIGGEEVVQRFMHMPDALRSALTKEVREIAIKLQRHVVADKLTGQVLHVRSGTLRRSINQKVISEPGMVLGIVGTNVKYGFLHEFGETVPAHIRMITKVFGHPLKDGPKAVQVKSYKMPERSFLRSALLDMKPEIEQRVKDAVAGEVKNK